MKKVIGNGLMAGVAMLLVSLVMSPLFNVLFPSLQQQYVTPFFRPWSDPLMSLIFLNPFIVGLLLALVWSNIHTLFTQGSVWKRGASFGLMYWLVASIPGMIMSYSSFNISLLMILSWTVTGLVQVVVGGLVLAKMQK